MAPVSRVVTTSCQGICFSASGVGAWLVLVDGMALQAVGDEDLRAFLGGAEGGKNKQANVGRSIVQSSYRRA